MQLIHNKFLHLSCLLLVSLLVLSPPSLPFIAPAATAYALSVGEERELGEKLLALVRREFKILDAPDISQYINRLGQEILNVAGPQYFDYHFFVINNREFNAFAAPSGLIVIHSGLIDAASSEGELVSVLAHEIAHVSQRHIAERIAKSTKINIGTAALLIAGIALGGVPAEAVIAGSTAAGATMGLKFSRQNEEEADRLAFKWMKAKGRDPAAMVTMLEEMRRISRYRRAMLPAYLLTHPEPEQRISYVKNLLLMHPPTQHQEQSEFEFQRIKHRIMAMTREPLTLLPLFLKKTSEEPTNIMAWYGLSQIYLALRDFNKAQTALQKVIHNYPDQTILTTDLGVIYFTSGQHHKALNILKAAVQKTPDCLYTSFYYARGLQMTGHSAKALELYKKLLLKLPDYAQLYFLIAEIQSLQNSHSKHYYIGMYKWLEGENRNARFHLKQAVKNLPAEHEIHQKAQEMLETIERLES